jgi:hypothetical protein
MVKTKSLFKHFMLLLNALSEIFNRFLILAIENLKKHLTLALFDL